MMLLLLQLKPAEAANQYINTTDDEWLYFVGHSCTRFAAFPVRGIRGAVRQSKAMPSLRKPVIVRKFSRDWCAGYAGASSGLGASEATPELEILDLTGKVLRIGWEQVKWVCYVRDLPGPSGDQTNPERLLHKRFSVRPRTAGLWLRMTLTDGEELEGLAANDRSLIEGAGLLMTPPDTRSNTQRIYIPRQAIQTLEVVSLIGAKARKRDRAAGLQTDQPELFPGESGTA
jgi:hypothetical protein